MKIALENEVINKYELSPVLLHPSFGFSFQKTRLTFFRYLQKTSSDSFTAYLKCGILAHGFLHLTCDDCKEEKLVAFSCKKRCFCPSCTGKRMTEGAAHLVDNILPIVPYRQLVVTFPFPIR